MGKRISKACAACRARKTKCDAKTPQCSYCVEHGMECDYEGPVVRPVSKRVRLDTASGDLQGVLGSILDRLDALEQRISNGQHTPQGQDGQSPQIQTPAGIIQEASVSSDISNVQEKQSKWWKSTLEDTLQWPALEYTGPPLRALNATMISNTNHGSVGPIIQDGRVISHLVELFIEEVHTKNPILDLGQINTDKTTVLTDGVGHDAESSFVLLYCALGAISCPFSPSTLHDFAGPGTSKNALRYPNHGQHFASAQERYGYVKRQSKLLNAQWLFLSGVYLMYSLDPWQALETFRMASLTCCSYITASQAQYNHSRSRQVDYDSLEQRLYWSCLKSETELAHEYGLEGSPLNRINYVHLLPSPPNPDLAPGSGVVQEQSWYYYLTEITLRKLEIEIHASFRRLHDEKLIEEGGTEEGWDLIHCIISGVIEFETQLESCWRRLPASMRIDLDDDGRTACPNELCEYLRIKLLWIKHDLLRIPFYLALHHSIGDRSVLSSPTAISLHQTVISMSNECLAVSVKLMRLALNTHRNHGSWFGPRISVRAALEILAAKKVDHLELQIPEDFEGAADALVEGLKWWRTEIRDADEYLHILNWFGVCS